MRSYVFPYVRFHGRYYPLIPLTLRLRNKSVNTFALLDSGASVSVFRPEMATALGIGRKKKDRLKLTSGTGDLQIDMAQLELQVEKTRFKTKIGFSKSMALSFNILGRDGFFNKFSVCFQELAKQVALVPLR